MTKYHHELPKDPEHGYPLAAYAPFDAAAHRPGGKTYERLHPQSCQCTTPRFDRLTRGGLTFDKFCCACRLPSEESLSAAIDQCFSARNLYLTGPAGYGFQTSEQGVTIYPPKGGPFPHRPGEQILDGHHHACWHAEMLWHTAYPFSVLPELPQRATPDEIPQTMRRIFDDHEILKGRCDFAVLPSEDSPYTRQVTILLDDVPLTAKRIADRTFAEIERDARVEAEATVALLEKRMAPETCPACDGHLSLCQECGGKGWLPRYKAAGLRIEKRAASLQTDAADSTRAPMQRVHAIADLVPAEAQRVLVTYERDDDRSEILARRVARELEARGVPYAEACTLPSDYEVTMAVVVLRVALTESETSVSMLKNRFGAAARWAWSTEGYLGQASDLCKHGHKGLCGFCRSENAPKCEHGHAHYCGHCGKVE